VDDVAQAACRGVMGQSSGGIYELGGPEVASLTTFVHRMLGIIRRRKLVINLPFFVGKMMAKSLSLAQFLSLGVFTNSVLTADQIEQLRSDNVVTDGAKTLADMGITATGMNSVVDQYLYRYRPYGQYAVLTESARNMRGTRTDSEF
jgi:uncharacterized protein YbjT (DUF2867 family)